MPYVIRPVSVRRSLCALLGAALFAFALPAVADACTPATGGSAAFSTFGDHANYSLAPSGLFESGAAGWSLTRSSVASGNDSFFIGSKSDSQSLSISANGSAVSPPICVDITTPTFRFAARRTSGSWAQMNVNLLWTAPPARHTPRRQARSTATPLGLSRQS